MSAAGLLLAYAGGLLIAPFFPLIPLLIPACLFLAAAWLFLRRRPAGALCLVAFFSLAGFSSYHQRLTPPAGAQQVRSFVSEQKLTVEGEVLALSPRHPDGAVIDLEAVQVGSGGIAAAVSGRIRLTVDAGQPTASPGDRLRFRARLRAPKTFGTPGEFNYPRYLAARSIFVTAFLPSAREIAILPAAGSSLAGLRGRIGREIERAVAPDLAPMVRALVIGDSGGISPQQRDLLARGGVSHLFAISGLHLGLVALFLFGIARTGYCLSERLLLWNPPGRSLPVLLLPLLYIYVQLTGSALPTRRAFLMAAVGAAFLLWGRRTPPLRLLAAAALLMLLVSPLSLFEPAFQLSFAGVGGILLLLPPWKERLARLPRLPRRGAALLLTTLAASLATLPFVLLSFHLLAPAGLLLNLGAVPAVGFAAVPLGLAGALFSPWWPAAGDLFFRGCSLVVAGVLELCAWAVSHPWLAGRHLYCSPGRLAAVFLMASALLLLARRTCRRPAAALAAAALVLFFLPASAPSGLTVTALSVGQGDAILLSRSGGRHYLVDGGGFTSGRFDVGERLVAPSLGWLGIRQLEAVVLTHDHPDHRLGLLHVLSSFPVASFWSSLPVEELDPELRQILTRRHIPVRRFEPGWTILDRSDTEQLAVFVPPPAAETNDNSLVLRAGYGSDAVLLTGDLEANGIDSLLAAPLPGPVNLLKLPHHGSRRSRPDVLMQSLTPEMAFVSLGAGNPHGFPHAETVAAVAALRVPLLRTDVGGSLRFHSVGRGWKKANWQRGLFR